MSAIDDIYMVISNLDLGGIQCRNLPEVTLGRRGRPSLRILVIHRAKAFVMIGTLQSQWAIHDLCL
jgi:hypothetical protein